MVISYIGLRREAKMPIATINRELATLKRGTPPGERMGRFADSASRISLLDGEAGRERVLNLDPLIWKPQSPKRFETGLELAQGA